MSPEVSKAVELILSRLRSVAGFADQDGPPPGARAIFEAVPPTNRPHVLSVLENLAGRADAAAQNDLAQGASLVLEAARGLWSDAGVRASKSCGAGEAVRQFKAA